MGARHRPAPSRASFPALPRRSAKKDLETGASIRAKEHEDFVASSGEQKANLEAMTGAIAALEKGMGGAFLQSGQLPQPCHPDTTEGGRNCVLG